jgi:hypothetical protein
MKNKTTKIMCLAIMVSIAFSILAVGVLAAEPSTKPVITLTPSSETISDQNKVIIFNVKIGGLKTGDQVNNLKIKTGDGFSEPCTEPIIMEDFEVNCRHEYKTIPPAGDNYIAQASADIKYMPKGGDIKTSKEYSNNVDITSAGQTIQPEATPGAGTEQAATETPAGGVGTAITSTAGSMVQGQITNKVTEQISKRFPGLKPEQAKAAAEKAAETQTKAQTTASQAKKPSFWTKLWTPAMHIIALHAQSATEAAAVATAPHAAVVETAAKTAHIIESTFTALSIAHGTLMAGTLAAKVGLCHPEEPLADDNCGTCNELGMFCTEARCKILGHNCVAVPTSDADRVLCLTAKCSTADMPKGFPDMTSMKVSAYVDRSGPAVSNKAGKKINNTEALKTDLGILPWNTTMIDLNVASIAQTGSGESKETVCRWSFQSGQKFEDMDTFDVDLFALEHSVTIDLNGLASDQNYTIYVKCKDACGAVPTPEDNPFWFKFTLGKEPDFVYPCYPDMATAYDAGKCFIDPWQASVPADLKTQTAQFWLDKPGECVFSTAAENFTTNWSEMNAFGALSPMIISGSCGPGKCLERNTSTCTHCNLTFDMSSGERINLNMTDEDLDKIGLSDAEATDVQNMMNMFQYNGEIGIFHIVVVCRNSQKIEMPPLDYILLSMPPYNVTIIKPPVNDSYERYPDIEVNTTHDTQCKYQVNKTGAAPVLKWEKMDWIDEENASVHIGKVADELVPQGLSQNYTIYVKCRDEGKLEVDASKTFIVKNDSEWPIAIRIYHTNDTSFGAFGSNLIIETNEPSDCVYGVDANIKCAYNFSDGNALTKAEDGYLHSAPWSLEHNYYVKCADKWNNYPGASSNSSMCTTIVSPYEVPPRE